MLHQPVELEYQTYRLANGLNVILSRDPSVPLVAVNLWYQVGSANERPGRTGFAHLFEHMMFQGSESVPADGHFRTIQEIGGTLNGSTSSDRTNYFQAVPANFLERVLWLEADRMASLLPAMTIAKLDNQRSVVKNERREHYDNAPYGLAFEVLSERLFPQSHPYSWSTIGSMDDLDAATLADVAEFFRSYYTPRNCSLAVVGDFDPVRAKEWIELHFGPIPPGGTIERPVAPFVRLEGERIHLLEDRVQLPRLYLAWPTPAQFEPGDAELDILGHILSEGENARLHRRLVRDERTAQWVSSFQYSRPLSGMFVVTVQGLEDGALSSLRETVDQELAALARERPPTEREVQRAVNHLETFLVRQMETALGRADALNLYYTFTGDPGALADELARYRKVTPEEVARAAAEWLNGGRVTLSVVPAGSTGLAAKPAAVEDAA
ncbi:MAG: M16 family metallopeptidase [Longimicrobiaceae bacterium]